MRAIRALAVAALVTLDVSAATAQASRHFKDSWFWGLKGGGLGYQIQSKTPDNPVEEIWGASVAPLAGFDWMITRTSGGLYLSFDRSFFDGFVIVNDSVSPGEFTACPGDPDLTCGNQVNLKDMHRFTLMGVLFPMQTYRMHPYVGFGATLNHIVRATPSPSFASTTQRGLVEGTVQQLRTVGSPVFMIGTQLRLPLSSAFVQISATPVSDNFFLIKGSGWRTTLEGGMRYNVGTSIDRMR